MIKVNNFSSQKLDTIKTTPSENKSPSDLIKRVACAALPFFSLYKPLGYVMAMISGTVRIAGSVAHLFSVANKDKVPSALLDTAIAVASLGCTIFIHPLGMILAAGYDLGCAIRPLLSALNRAEHRKALEASLNILSNGCYLVAIGFGSMHIAAAAMALQLLLGLYHGIGEFKKGNYIEGFAHIGMSAVRGSGLTTHLQKGAEERSFFLRREKENPPYVGKLGDQWQFPSDHLPVGVKVGNTNIITWNVLDKAHLSWVYEDTQGLNGSMITKLNHPESSQGTLTKREALTIDYIIKIIDYSSAGEANQQLILTLQECHPDLIRALIPRLPPNIGIILSDPTLKALDQNIVLYSKDAFTYLDKESSIVRGAFSEPHQMRPLMDLLFQEKYTTQKWQVIQAHLPGGDSQLAIGRDFTKYILEHSRKDAIVIGAGDMNHSPEQMHRAFSEETLKRNEKLAFENYPTYNTVISPHAYTARAVDQIWIAQNGRLLSSGPLSPEAILPGVLRNSVDQLNPESARIRQEFFQAKLNKQEELTEFYRHREVCA